MPIVHPTSFIHPTATVCGNVTLGVRVSVWAGAVIRGDSDSIEMGMTPTSRTARWSTWMKECRRRSASVSG